MPAQIRTVLEVFHDDPSLRITLAELARRVSLSTFQLIRAFQHRVGLPPHAYLKQLRITRAQRLLREGLSIADAALASGFSDHPHLTREFGPTLGMTPGQYVAIRQR
jgi:transcriptional regulator GlxA family with amidase domain